MHREGAGAQTHGPEGEELMACHFLSCGYATPLSGALRSESCVRQYIKPYTTLVPLRMGEMLTQGTQKSDLYC